MNLILGSGYDPNNSGQYVPTGEGQYIHQTGPAGPGPDPYNHVTGPQGNVVECFRYGDLYNKLSPDIEMTFLLFAIYRRKWR